MNRKIKIIRTWEFVKKAVWGGGEERDFPSSLARDRPTRRNAEQPGLHTLNSFPLTAVGEFEAMPSKLPRPLTFHPISTPVLSPSPRHPSLLEEI